MKIGIVTQPLIGNYGGILQNYALQMVLKSIGHDPITLNVVGRIPWSRYWRIALKSTAKNILKGRINIPERQVVSYKGRSTQFFVEKYLDMTRVSYSYESSMIEDYSLQALVVGSDQVWRPIYNDRIEDMFLDFARKKTVRKIAYSASFGTDEWEMSNKQTKKCLRLAQLFSGISVREDSGIALCGSFLSVKATRTLDPTLLLNVNTYERICADIPKREKRFVGAYFLDPTQEKYSILKTLSSVKGIDYSIISGISVTCDSITVEEWLAMFRDADFIVTDSFHGTVFAILFHKEFVVIPNMNRGYTRFQTLLSLFNLESRLLNDDLTVLGSHVDWDSVDSILYAERKSSIDYLNTFLTK